MQNLNSIKINFNYEETNETEQYKFWHKFSFSAKINAPVNSSTKSS